MPPVVSFGSNAKRETVSTYSLKVLSDICDACGVTSVIISSTQRSPSEQARVMYENLVVQGPAKQHTLYGPVGDKVIDVYEQLTAQKRSKAEIIAGMTAKIVELGPSNVSHHAADPKVLNVFDVAPSSIPVKLRAAFEKAVMNDKRVKVFFTPPKDPGYHLEIPQPA